MLGRKFAYMLVPLPEPIGLPVRVSFPHVSYESFAEFLNRVEASDDRESQAPELLEFISLIVHNVDVAGDDAVVRNTSALLRLAREVFPWALTDEQRANAGPPLSDSPIRQHLTIVEMAYLLPEEFSAGEEDDDATLTAALDAGIEKIRDLQRAYFLAYKYPMQLVSRELLPPMVPVAVAVVASDGVLQPEQTLTMLPVDGSALGAIFRDQDPVTESEPLSQSIKAISDNLPFLTYLDSLREARVAQAWRGDFRGAVVYSATAAEALLDELLLHMMWEECVSPEVAAEKFVFPNLAIQTRVRRDYEPRLGGTWATSRPGPIEDWSKNIAGVRHKAIHAGYEPSRAEAGLSLNSLVELERFVTARLSDPKRLRNYPRTALAIMGEPGLRKRGLWRGRVKAVAADSTEPDWAVLYARWRSSVERIRLEDQGMAGQPNPTTAALVAILSPDQETRWVLWDQEAGMAAEASRPQLPEEDGDDDPMAEYREQLLEDGRLTRPTSAVTPDSWRDMSKRVGDWKPAYHLVPDAACMLDLSDPAYSDREWSGQVGKAGESRAYMPT